MSNGSGAGRPLLRAVPSLLLPRSVRARIIAGFGLLVLILAVVVAGSAWLAREHHSAQRRAEHRAAVVSHLQDAKTEGAMAYNLLQGYVISGDETAVPQARRRLAAAALSLAAARSEAEAGGQEPESARLTDFLMKTLPLAGTTDRIIALRQSGDSRGAADALAQAAPAMQRLETEFDAFAEELRQEAAALRARAGRTAGLAFWLLVASGALGAAVALAASVFIARSILGPLASLESAALAVAGGDLAVRAPAKGPRELARLGESLNRMTESLLDAGKRRELEEERGRLAEILEKTPDMVGIANLHERGLYLNSAGRKMLGIPQDEADPAPNIVDYHPEWAAKLVLNEGIPSALRDGTWSGETALLSRDGREIPVSQVIVAHKGPDGAVGYISTIARDISDRKQAEEALRRSEEHFRSLIENATDVITVIDREGTILYESPSIKRVLGYEPEELVGRRAFELVHPDDLPNVVDHFREGFKNPRPGQSNEFRFRHKDGSWRLLESIGGPLAGESGELLGVVNSRDITERRQAEEALQSAEALYRGLFENVPVGLYRTTPAGEILDANPAIVEMMGYPDRESYLKLGAADLYVDSDDRRRWQAMMDRDGVVRGFEARARRRDGSTFWVRDNARALRDETGRVLYYEGTWEDITPAKVAAEQLQRLNRELEELNRSLEEKVQQRTEELRLANEELRERNRQLMDARAQAATDALTGLANHRTFHETIRDQVRRAQVTSAPIGLIMLDIDGFKRVNDSLGHQEGDRILRELAAALADLVGQEGLFRYGGDEFAVLLPGVDRRRTVRLAQRLRRAVQRRINGGGGRITVSLGAASFPDTAATAEELVYGADAAMYWSKAAGKDRVSDWCRLVRQKRNGSLPWYAGDQAVKAPDVVTALVAALAAKDPATKAHTERCSWYAARLAEELGLDEQDTSTVRLASLLHDIGKLAVPDEVLFKAGPLSESEWAQMKRHPTTALHILAPIPSIADATPAVLHHHERFDGSGYPDGLAGEEIPVASRILLVTDAFDAMTTDRPYRRALSVKHAVEELQRHAGSQFDPEVVGAFLRVLSRCGPEPLGCEAAAGGRARAASPA